MTYFSLRCIPIWSICHLLFVGPAGGSDPARQRRRTGGFPGAGLIEPDYPCSAVDSIDVLGYCARFFAAHTSGHSLILRSGVRDPRRTSACAAEAGAISLFPVSQICRLSVRPRVMPYRKQCHGSAAPSFPIFSRFTAKQAKAPPNGGAFPRFLQAKCCGIPDQFLLFGGNPPNFSLSC